MAGEKKVLTAGKAKKPVKKTKQPVRLYAKGLILGYKRSKSNCYANTTLLKIDGVRTKEDTQFYVGKRVAYVYKAKKEVKNSKFRVMWGKVRTASQASCVPSSPRTSHRRHSVLLAGSCSTLAASEITDEQVQKIAMKEELAAFNISELRG
ncbi:unnamed protein product [Polarella glacialis]|uniref:60S ribosomal protein L35a n=1 Tax=Polarella glacialis TaxID=89957 RepID=A0A813K4X0_POLGL|nr:unnamed protein product [Polarella glacialis]